MAAIVSTVAAAIATYSLQSPMPLIAAFAFCAVTVARMEDETI